MIDVVRLIKTCEVAVGSHVSIEFNDANECNQMIRMSFKWCANNDYHNLRRVYSHQMMLDVKDVTDFIIDDFIRQANWEPLK